MTNLDMQRSSSDPAVIRFWQRIPVVIRAIVSGLFVSTIGVMVWLAIVVLIPSPWFIVIMSGVLWLFWKYFSGSWWPKATAEARCNSFREVKLSASIWKWGLVGAVLFVVVVQSGFVITFRIMEFPAETFTSEYNFDAMPLWLAWLTIIMASLVAGICEETGFRGYMQVPLEKRYGPGVGITMVSIMFLIIHFNQAWAPTVIGHIGIDIFNFSYWWSDVAGKFERRTIFETGIDFHFMGWLLIFGVSIVLFFVVIRKIGVVRRQT